MNKIIKTNWRLLARYFAGECNDAELAQLEQWLDSGPKNKLLFEKLKEDQETINEYKKMKKVNVDNAWDNVLNKIQDTQKDRKIPGIHINAGKKLKISPVLLKVAATFLILIGLYFTYKIFMSSENKTVSGYLSGYTTNNTTQIILPDGSKVFLNADTKISYPKKFIGNIREVILYGEAFFEVVPNANKPFIVRADKANVRVLGTSFLVNTHTVNKNNVEVYVETGKVQLYESEDNHILIEPGYTGQLNKKTLSRSLNKNKNIIAWKTKKITFGPETRLEEVVKVLEHTYNEKIVIKNDNALKCVYKGTFDNVPFDSVIKTVAKTFGFEIKYENNKVVLLGKGC